MPETHHQTLRTKRRTIVIDMEMLGDDLHASFAIGIAVVLDTVLWRREVAVDGEGGGVVFEGVVGGVFVA